MQMAIDTLYHGVFEEPFLSKSKQSGPVAQLGARFHGMEEVVGSIPTRSTIKSTTYGPTSKRLAGNWPEIWPEISRSLRRFWLQPQFFVDGRHGRFHAFGNFLHVNVSGGR